MTFFSEKLFISGSGNIFTFGSNLSGRHGAGAAKFALEFCGAEYGNGYGLQGNSFALPTKDEAIRPLPLNIIEAYVQDFLNFASQNTQFAFYVTAIGTGLAMYTDIQIAPMFVNAPPNCVLPARWKINNNLPLFLVDKT